MTRKEVEKANAVFKLLKSYKFDLKYAGFDNGTLVWNFSNGKDILHVELTKDADEEELEALNGGD